MDDYIRARDVSKFLKDAESFRIKQLQLQWIERQRTERSWMNPTKDRIGAIVNQYALNANKRTHIR
jgi:predicted ATP-dependent protease